MSRSAVLSAIFLVLLGCHREYDAAFDTSVARPAFTTHHPRIAFDQGHHNHHSISGSYRPFVELMRHDGYEVEAMKDAVTSGSLRDVNILAVVTAMGRNDTNDAPAFSTAECDAIDRWVAGGGSLLLVTDHYPFGPAVANLARRFGVEMSGGMTFDEVNFDRPSGDDSQLVFSRENGLLTNHPLTRGVNRVVTFTGQSLRGGVPLLRLADTAVNRAPHPHVVRDGGDVRVNVEYGPPEPARGWSQAVVAEHGRGRVAILAEAAMLSAQRNGKRLVGMNLPGCDNRQFALNLMHWLSHT